MLVAPIAHLEAIGLEDANAALERWGHRVGPCHRPNGHLWAHGLFEHGALVAVAVSAALIRETCQGFDRSRAFELARLCGARPHLCRPMLRLWREFVFPPLCRCHGWDWAVSYQDEALHSGDLYRFDGWVRLGRSRSGRDPRSGRQGRTKTVWGWHGDDAVRAAARRAA